MKAVYYSDATVQQHNQTIAAEHIYPPGQKEVSIWINWIVTVGALFSLSAVSFALNWPLIITCLLTLLTSLYSFVLGLMALLLLDKDAFK